MCCKIIIPKITSFHHILQNLYEYKEKYCQILGHVVVSSCDRTDRQLQNCDPCLYWAQVKSLQRFSQTSFPMHSFKEYCSIYEIFPQSCGMLIHRQQKRKCPFVVGYGSVLPKAFAVSDRFPSTLRHTTDTSGL